VGHVGRLQGERAAAATRPQAAGHHHGHDQPDHRRAYGDIDWMDALYKVYVTAIFSAVGGSMLSGWIGGRPVTPSELDGAVDRGPALVGVVVAVVVAGGLRSGGRGGPLALALAAAAAMLVAALDSVEGLAQEADHPLRRDTLPVPRGRLLVRHLTAPSAVMLVVAVVAVGGAAALGEAGTVLAVGAVVVVPAALSAAWAAALSIDTGPVNPLQVELFGSARLVIRSVAPALLTVAGVLPVLAAKAALDAGAAAVEGAVPAAMAVLMLVAAVAAWLAREG